MTRLWPVFFCIICLWAISSAQAQEQAFTESDYWQQLQSTLTRYQAALGAPAFSRTQILTEERETWAAVERVRLEPQGAIIDVDTRWLQLPPNASDDEIESIINRIRALQDYSGQAGLSLDGLEGLVEPPTPPPASRGIDFNPGPLVRLAFRLTLIAAGVILAVGAIVLVARGLRRTAARAKGPGFGAGEDTPQTAAEAQSRASQSAQHRNYRDAIRYLYLSSLLVLDESGLIRYDPTLTNREHLAQISQQPALAHLLGPIISIFDRTWYGFSEVTDEEYQQYRQQVEQLRQLAAEQNG